MNTFTYIVTAAAALILLVCGITGIVSLIVDAHDNGQKAREGTKRAGNVEIREE